MMMFGGVMFAVLALVGLSIARSFAEDPPTPGLYEVEGNPNCANLYMAEVISGPDPDLLALGPLFGLKYDDNPTGDVSSALTNNAPWVVTNGPQDPNNSVSISNVVLNGGEGVQFDWSATLGLDAVIVKAQDANAYVYSPEAFGDSGLMAPDGKAISHVEFCYDYELAATKTANAEYTRTYTWDITKDFDGTYDGFIGDPAFDHGYQVVVDQTTTDSAFAVSGTIVIENTAPYPVTFDVSDVVGDVEANVVCPTYALTANDGASGGNDEVTCTYSATLDSKTDGTNTATVTSSTMYGSVPMGSATATADYAFGDPTTVVGEPTVNVTDDLYGSLGSTSEDKTFTYTGSLQCPSDPTDYVDGVAEQIKVVNTATIVETDQSDDATVTLDCYAPVASKNAQTSYTRTYSWDITKDYDGTYSGFIGDPSFDHQYKVTVDQIVDESAFVVSGTISVENPNPSSPMTVTLADSVGGTAATLDCGGSLTIPKGDTATCGYTAELDTKTDGTNTATATLNDIGFDATAGYEFGEPTTVEGYPTVTVTDSRYGPLGSASDDAMFKYTGPFQCSADPADYTNGVATQIEVVNTATINETGQSDSAKVTLDCYAPVLAKDADASYDETHTWSIEKSVSPTSQSGLAGETLPWTWTVNVSETSVDENFSVTGDIDVSNPAGSPGAMTVSLVDQLNDGTFANVDCGDGATSVTVAPGTTESCSYTAAPDGKTATSNTATGTFNEIDFTAGAEVSFVKNVVGGTATVTDTQIGLDESLTAGDGPWTFTAPDGHTCSTDQSSYGSTGSYSGSEDNLATVTAGNGQTASDDATTAYACYAPIVSKTVGTSTFDQFRDWKLTKTVDPLSQSGYPGDELAWTWTVTADETTTTVAGSYLVSGVIEVKNPAPTAMTVIVSDSLDTGDLGLVDCDPITTGDQPTVTIAAGETAACSYDVFDASPTATSNTATATLSGIPFTSAPVPVSFVVGEIIDEEATLADPRFTYSAVISGDTTKTFDEKVTCSSSYAAYGADGEYGATEDNLATLTLEDGTVLQAPASTTWLCEAVTVDLLKTTDGIEDPDAAWNFALYLGPNGFGTTPIATDSTPPAYMDFGGPALRPDTTYTVCETGIPAGWTSFWQLNGSTVIPYNPDADSSPPEDVGNRCVDFGGTVATPASTGTVFSFAVDNSYPGGDPRTPGYWKNWNRCTGGGQQYTADANGGYAEGYWLLEDVLDPAIGGGIVWDDILTQVKDIPPYVIGGDNGCAIAVDILDKRVVADPAVVGDGKKAASDPLVNLATHLLAAQLNFGAGACTTPDVSKAALDAETLLDKYNFDGRAGLLSKKDKVDASLANSLAAYLDLYNNGEFCGSTSGS